MEQTFDCDQLKAWEKAASGHFFDDIDTVLSKLKTPHPDELSQYYQCDDVAIDPLSPELSEEEDDDDAEQTKIDPSNSIVYEELKQFDYMDEDYLNSFNCVYDISSSDIPETSTDEYAQYYEFDDSFKLRKTNIISTKNYQKHISKRLHKLLFDLENNESNRLLALLAHYLKHKFSTYNVLLQDYLNGDIAKELFENILEKLFKNCTNSVNSDIIFKVHNCFILSLWPNMLEEYAKRDKSMQPFGDVDIKFYTKQYQYQKRKRTHPTFSDLFHSQSPEYEIVNKIDDFIEYSFQTNNLQTPGPIIHQKCPTLFLNTKYYMDKFWKENNGFLPDPTVDKQANDKLDKQMLIIQNLWFTELTHAYRIESKLMNFEKYNITKGRFRMWFQAQLRYFQYYQKHNQNSTIRFFDIRIQTPNECDEDYCPMLLSLRKLPIDRIPVYLCTANDKKLLDYHRLQLRFASTIGKDIQKNKILFINKQAIELCHIALMKFMKNFITELIALKPKYRNINKKFDRFKIIDNIVPKTRTEYYPDLVREIHAKNLDDILLSEDDRQFSQNLFYRSMLKNENFDLEQKPINELDLLASLQNSHTILPNRKIWNLIKNRLISRLSS